MHTCRSLILFFFFMVALFTISNSSSGSRLDAAISPAESLYIATVNDSSKPLSQRLEALDSLADYKNPLIFSFFKDIAFRNSTTTLSVSAVAQLDSFAGTYRWSELCDTLVDVVKSFPIESIRYAALQAVKVTQNALVHQMPFDRNNVVDMCTYILSPATYVKDAKSFFSAVWLVSELGCKNDSAVISMLEYIRDNFQPSYHLDNMLEATDAHQVFNNKIGKTYLDNVKERTAPPLFSIPPPNPSTSVYISAVAFLLDSAVTDSLGFAAIEWLKANGEKQDGNEGERLMYLYTNAGRKRPDIAGKVMVELQPVLSRFGVGAKLRSMTKKLSTTTAAAYNFTGKTLRISALVPEDIVAIYDVSGKVLYRVIARSSQIQIESALSAGNFIVTVNNQTVVQRITR